MNCQAVIFDVGDIFYDATPWRRWLTRHLQDRGVSIDYPTLCTKWETRLVPVYRGQLPYWQAFRTLLGDLGLPAIAASQVEDAARCKAASVASAPLFDGIALTLATLQARDLRLAVLSDTESTEPTIRNRLDRWQIGRYFDAVVTSATTGYVKPEPQAYTEALERLAAVPEESAFVGHDPDELDGAAAVGMITIAFNSDTAVYAKYHLDHFQDLPDLLNQADDLDAKPI